jgi:hypothetical protein
MQMKYPRDVLVLFAILDVFLAGRFATSIHIPQIEAQEPVWWTALSILRPIFLLSLLASAFGLATQRRWGFIVSYIQFPFRFAYVLLSFGFLSLIPGTFIQDCYYQPVILIAMGMECGRLVWTIAIHRRMRNEAPLSGRDDP